MFKNFLLPLALLCFTCVLSAQKSFPTPELVTVDNQVASLTDYVGQGKPTVIAIWATWCQPCHMELDDMKGHLAKWKIEYGATVLAISVDKRHMVNRIKPLVSRKGWAYDILVDTDGKLQAKLGFRSIPQMYVLDGDGNVVKSFTGYQHGREAQVEKLFKQMAK
jgi:peroxiredoxin